MDAGQYRARSGTEIIDAAFQILRSHFAPLFTLGVISSVPLALFQLTRGARGAGGPLQWTLAILLFIILLATAVIVSGALVAAVDAVYHGREIDIAAVLKIGRAKAKRMFAVGFAMWVLTGIGFVLLVIPGFIVLAWLFVAPVIVVLESPDLSTTKVIERSRELCRDHKRRVLAFFLVLAILFFILGILEGVVAVTTRSTTVTIIVAAAINAIMWPLHPILMTLHYYDMRIRKEGYDVELLAGGAPVSVDSAPVVA